MKPSNIIIVFLVVVLLCGCGTTGNGTIYFERSVKRSDVEITRVAIVPNRLPLNLQDPEKWRRINWQIIKREFEEKGFDVVDYAASVSAFERSGLPIEDAKSSRDKYADLAEALNVDAVIIPYYGTFASMKNVVYLVNTASFVGVATFQIYLRKQNDFFSRIDCSGEDSYSTGIFMPIAIGIMLIDPTAGLAAQGLGFLHDLVVSLRSADSRWEDAFTEAIHEGLAPLFASIGPPARTTEEPPSLQPQPESAPAQRKFASGLTPSGAGTGVKKETPQKKNTAQPMKGESLSQLGLGLSLASVFPVSNGDYIGPGAGGTLQLIVHPDNNVSVGILAGYFQPRSMDPVNSSVTWIPVNVRAYYYLGGRRNRTSLRLGGFIGATFEKRSFTSYNSTYFGSVPSTTGITETFLAYGPAVGIRIPTPSGAAVDFLAEYNIVSNQSVIWHQTLNFSVGVHFNLK